MLGSPKAQAIDSDPNPADREILGELFPPNRQAEGRRFLRRLESASQSGEIPDDFDVPAAGAGDPVVPTANLRRIAARIPQAKLVVFPGAHAFLFQERRSFSRAVNKFLRRG